MSNRTIEAVMRLSAKLGPMGAFDKIGAKLNQVNQKSIAFNRTQGLLNRTMSAMPIGRFIGPAVAGYALTQSIKEFASVERQLTRIGLTLGASRDDMQGLYQDVNHYAKAYALQSDQVMETVGAYAAAGASLTDIRNDLDLLTKSQQALGASGEDVVNSWNTARLSLGLTTKDAEKFFSIIAAGSSAGKFEAPDMSRFLPSLLPSAAKQGFQGIEGAQRMVGFLEVMANYTGTVGEAATSVGDFLEKLSSPDVEKRLAKISGSFLKRMSAARENGEDMLKVTHDILMEATGGKADRLGQIFGDKEARQAATVILAHYDEIVAAQKEIAANAPGVLDRNNAQLLKNTQAGLDRIKETLSQLQIQAGDFAASLGVVDGLKYIVDTLGYANSVNAGLEKSGVHGFAARTAWGITHGDEDKDMMARRGGYRSDEELRAAAAYKQYGDSRRAGMPRDPSFGAGTDANGVPIPLPYGAPTPLGPVVRSNLYPAQHGRGSSYRPDSAWSLPPGGGGGPQPDGDWFAPVGAEIEDKIASGGQQAGQSITDGAKQAGGIFAAMVAGIGKQLGTEAGAAFNATARAPTLATVRADTGRSRAGHLMGPR
ncbi:phage tail tape measure protein [Mesorhizobium sp. M0664]|uniref:phage tail tape measure protein n=1 Tax=Mesorhizobium sp. M0664 TaxID=2956982 RepID=UPI0033384297